MQNKFRGAILGTAIGDALGAPVETWQANDIKEQFPNFEANCEYISRGARKAGQWTDDTQLMIPTAWSIVYKGSISPADIAAQYASVGKNEPRRGWGRSTIKSVDRLIDGYDWIEASDESFGRGNGAAMKAAPLGLVVAQVLATGSKAEMQHCLNSIVDVGKITHKLDGIHAGLLQSVAIGLAVHDIKTPSELASELLVIEQMFFNTTDLSMKAVELFKENTIEDICIEGGVTSLAEQSWPTTMAVFLKILHQKINPMKGLAKLIAQGGDCDTTGAMLGALIGARYGAGVFPQKLLRTLEDADKLDKMAQAMFVSLTAAYERSQEKKLISAFLL